MITAGRTAPPLPSTPPEAWEPLLRLARIAGRPLERFLRIEAASGILLLSMAVVALVWANSPWEASYTSLWHTPIGVNVGSFHVERSLAWFVNDVLMVIFFFVVGVEIRRELHHGGLAEWRRAALPVVAGLGGMLTPALLYLVLAGGAATRSGWGVPMATDIAFAVGVLALLGSRVPAALRVLLLALAIIDDLGAIVIIAVFYSSGIVWSWLLVATLGIVGIFAMRAFGVRRRVAYVAPAVVVWAGVYGAGIHPTIAGVIVGLVTPVRAWLGPDGFVRLVHRELDHLAENEEHLSSHDFADTLKHVDAARREAMSPGEGLIEDLHPWVAFLIMPIFALANAGVPLGDVSLSGASVEVSSAVAIGLVLGKPLGVVLASVLALRLRIARLPSALGLRHLVVLGLAAGIGFTMALFVGQLAFSDPSLLSAAKVGVLVASVVAGVLSLMAGRLLLRPSMQADVAQSADEAESTTSPPLELALLADTSALPQPLKPR